MMPSLKQARRDVREASPLYRLRKFAYDVGRARRRPEDAPVAMELEPDASAVDEARAEALRQAELSQVSSTVFGCSKGPAQASTRPRSRRWRFSRSVHQRGAIRLVRRDASLHPLKGGTLTNDAPLPEFSDDELARARALIDEEASRAEPVRRRGLRASVV